MQLLDLLGDPPLLGIQLIEGGLVFGGVVFNGLHQFVGLVPLGAELFFLVFQLGLDRDQFRLAGFQPGLFLLDLRLEVLQVLDHLTVIVHDLVDDVQPPQQVGKAGGLEQH